METAPSPFLPGTKIQFAWDSTSLGWFKECPRLYQYFMIEGWSPKGEHVHLKFGGLYHSALEHYDMARALGHNHEEALNLIVHQTLIDTWEHDLKCVNGHDRCEGGAFEGCPYCEKVGGKPWVSEHETKTRETLIRSIIWYLEQFGVTDPAETVILADGKPAVELSFRMELDWGPSAIPQSIQDQERGFQRGLGRDEDEISVDEKNKQPYLLCGHLDRVANYAGGTYVFDRKTTGSALGSNYFDQYDPDNQMSLYSLAAQVIYKTPAKGVVIDAAQVMVGFTRFGRGFTYRTPAQTAEWLNDVKHWFRLAEEYATEGYWPMNDKSCHKYGGCMFRKVCSKSPEVRQRFLESDFDKRSWNPLEVR
jgi:hypothetical protein